MTLGRKFARPVAKWYLWPGHMLNQQHLYVRGRERGVNNTIEARTIMA